MKQQLQQNKNTGYAAKNMQENCIMLTEHSFHYQLPFIIQVDFVYFVLNI